METMAKNNLQSFAFSNNIFEINQHGFLPDRSTCTQIIECQYNWYVTLNNNIVTDVLFIDFTKAFDVVPHSKLIHKLASLVVYHTTLHLIKAFLHDRYQSVILNGSYFSQSAVTSGVIQDSVLRPTLFTLYVNDFPEAALIVRLSSSQMIPKPASKLSRCMRG